MKYIKLTNTEEMALIDDDDFELISQFKWRLSSKDYAITTIDGKVVLMHRLILDARHGDGKEIDHHSRYKLDNRKKNLRFVPHSVNMLNRGSVIYRNTTGVSWHKARQMWQARIQYAGKRTSLGLFKDEQAAIDAVHKAREEILL